MSNIRAGTISGVNGTDPVTLTKQSAAKAWYNYDHYFSNVIRDSFNFSSATDGGTGILTGSFTNSMSNASYGTATACGLNNSYRAIFSFDVGAGDYNANSIRGIIRQCDSTNNSLDTAATMLQIHGDLA